MSDENEISLESLGLQIMNLPEEFRDSMMWAGSTYKLLDPKTGRRDKAPRNVKTGDRLSVTSPEGWVDFYTAMNSGYPVIGCRMTADDPYTVIDLDRSSNEDDMEMLKKVYRSFKSYTEFSASGNGYHIILKGEPQAGRRRRNVEVYSQERYIICTGNLPDTRRGLDIIDGGKTLDNLIKSLTPSDNPDSLPIIENKDETQKDESIIRAMFSAENGKAIENLYRTKPGPDDDWSLLDSRLAQHICFYTKNHNQALRLFRGSALYRGDGSKAGYERVEKYEEDYLLRRTFARAWYLEEQREIARKKESDEIAAQFAEKNKIKARPAQVPPADETPHDEDGVVLEQLNIKNYADWLSSGKLPPMSHPTGLMGEMANYIYKSAPRPVKEVAYAGAMSLMGGLVGRHYNCNGTGLGVYIVLLAGTGRGKEAASAGVSNIMEAVSNNAPVINMFRGPSQLASGQGLTRMLADETSIPSKVMILSEFGHTMNIITDGRANAADQRTRQVMLDLFSKNRWNGIIKETAYSDSQKNTADIKAPNLTILGDTTPTSFFKAIKVEHIAEGFIPRFMIIEYQGPRVTANYNANTTVPTDLTDRVTALTMQVMSMRDANVCLNIELDKGAELIREFEDFCDSMINRDDDEKTELWNRAGIKAIRLAGLFAVSDNIFDPKVSEDNAKLAIEYVLRDMLSYELRFQSGEFGGGELQREAIMARLIFDYFEGNVDYKKERVHQFYLDRGLLTSQYIVNKLKENPAFNNTNKGARNEIDSCLTFLTHEGLINSVDSRAFRGRDIKVVNRTERVFARGDDYHNAVKNYRMISSIPEPLYVPPQDEPEQED